MSKHATSQICDTFALVNQKPFINIEEIIASKNPRLARLMPSFVLRYIRRILHEDEINRFMEKNGHLRDLEFIASVIQFFNLNIVVKGIENIPAHGGFLLASNHPLGGLDGIALMHAVGQKRKDIRFLVNDILLYLGTMDQLFVPVNKHGSQTSVARIEEAYRSDHAVLIFPAGLVSRKQQGRIMDLEWKKSVVSKSLQYHKPVIPTYIEGKNSNFFYGLASIRKRLGIKANIEMFYLADEMFAQKNKTITIIFGEPVLPSTFNKSKSHREWAQVLKEKSYSLSEGKAGPLTK